MSETNWVILDMKNWIGFLPTVLAIGLAGGITGSFMLSEISFVAITFCAATISGAISVVGFGRAGAKGWTWAALSALFATAFAAFGIGLAFNFSRALSFIDAVFSTLVFIPMAGILWVVLMVCAHLAARHWRQMRNSDFRNG